MDAILATYSRYYEDNPDIQFASDDFGVDLKVQQYCTSMYQVGMLVYALWNDENTIDTRCTTWAKEYTKVYYANLVLDNIDKVSGDQAFKDNLAAEAHFLRAYCYFQLALAHTLYYDGKNGDELGITLKSSTSFEETSARASLAKTWEFIDADVQAALKITKKFVNNDGVGQTWRGTTAGVNAFAARYYLYRGDYTKAKTYAEDALKEYGVLMDYNTKMYFDPSQKETYKINVGTPDEKEIVIEFPWTKPQLDVAKNVLEWDEMLYARSSYNMYEWYVPSQGLLDAFKTDVPGGDPHNDLRYHYFMHEDFGVRRAEKTDNGRLPGYCQFYDQAIVSGPNTAEMNLIIAECVARSGDWSGSMAYVNKVRKNRIKADVYADLTASSQADAIKKILMERRREMPFTIRWYDLKRLNAYDPDNKVTIKRTFYPYTSTSVLSGEPLMDYVLEPGSRHYAIPISNEELANAAGLIEQNKY